MSNPANFNFLFVHNPAPPLYNSPNLLAFFSLVSGFHLLFFEDALFTSCFHQAAQPTPLGSGRSEERLSQPDHRQRWRRRLRHKHLLQLLQRGFLHQLLAEGPSVLLLLKCLLFIYSSVSPSLFQTCFFLRRFGGGVAGAAELDHFYGT